jgi:hypothetical protein
MTSPARFTAGPAAFALLFSLLSGPAAAQAQAAVAPVSASGLPAFGEAMLTPEFWIARTPDPDAVLLDARQLAERRRLAYAPGGGLVDLRAIPATLAREQVATWIRQAEQTPVKVGVDEQGRPVKAGALDAARRNTSAGRIAATTPAGFGLSVRRAQMRALPTELRFFAAADLRDNESLQAGILLPGEPVLIAHRSADRRWVLAVTTQGPAWIRSEDIAEGRAEAVFGFAGREPGRVVTGDQVRTVFTPEAPEVS